MQSPYSCNHFCQELVAAWAVAGHIFATTSCSPSNNQYVYTHYSTFICSFPSQHSSTHLSEPYALNTATHPKRADNNTQTLQSVVRRCFHVRYSSQRYHSSATNYIWRQHYLYNLLRRFSPLKFLGKLLAISINGYARFCCRLTLFPANHSNLTPGIYWERFFKPRIYCHLLETTSGFFNTLPRTLSLYVM